MKIRFAILCFLLLGTTAFIQSDVDFIQTFKGKLQNYKFLKPHVKVFLFFNQDVYAPGDTAYFAAHFLSEDMTPIGGRQIIRVELMDQSGMRVFFENIAVKDGNGANQLAIPNDLKAGVYQWVAFSDWMKNFAPEFYFRQDFLLVEKNSLVKATKNDPLVLRFYPEGGTLISSVKNKIVVTSNVDLSSPIRIVDQAGNETTQIQLQKDKPAHFELTPLANNSYYAETQHLGKTIRFNLPNSTPDGFSMIMSALQDPVKVDIRSPRESKLRKSNLWLIITAHSEVYFSAPVRFEDRELITVQFPSKDLPPGICNATLFNEEGEVLAERIFKTNSLPEIKVNVTKSQAVYNTRSDVEMRIAVNDLLGNPLQGSFAISILNQRLFNSKSLGYPIEHYMYVTSDVPDLIETDTAGALDVWLITQKNKRLAWKEILEGNLEVTNSFKRLVQYTGRVVNAENGQPLTDSTHMSVYLQKSMMGYEVLTRKDGHFDLDFLFDFWDDDAIFYTLENTKGRKLNAKVLWDNDTSSNPLLSPMIEGETANGYADFANRKRMLDKSYNFYGKSESRVAASVSQDPNFDFEDELTGVDFTVNVEDYVVFPTMEELIREVVPSLQHRRVKGNSVVRVILPDGAIPKEDPLLIIDGIMTKNTDYFLQLKPSELISIKIVRTPGKLNRFGTMGLNGIVLVNSKGIDHQRLKRENTLIDVKGINRPTPFRIPAHADISDQRTPDFRSTLYWSPYVVTNSRGEGVVNFSASDDVGNFLIHVKGITSDGRPFSHLDSIRVIFSKN